MFDWAALTDDPAKYAVVATSLVPLLFFPRDETSTLFRSLVYYSLLPYVAAALWTKRVPSKSHVVQVTVLSLEDKLRLNRQHPRGLTKSSPT